jgi:hypothetical protein
MVRQSSREQRHPAERLASRHIFLDTQVYRTLDHNPANRALALLKEQVNSHRVVLHTTDITLLEVRRQIRELVLEPRRMGETIFADRALHKPHQRDIRLIGEIKVRHGRSYGVADARGQPSSRVKRRRRPACAAAGGS